MNRAALGKGQPREIDDEFDPFDAITPFLVKVRNCYHACFAPMRKEELDFFEKASQSGQPLLVQVPDVLFEHDRRPFQRNVQSFMEQLKTEFKIKKDVSLFFPWLGLTFVQDNVFNERIFLSNLLFMYQRILSDQMDADDTGSEKNEKFEEVPFIACQKKDWFPLHCELVVHKTCFFTDYNALVTRYQKTSGEKRGREEHTKEQEQEQEQEEEQEHEEGEKDMGKHKNITPAESFRSPILQSSPEVDVLQTSSPHVDMTECVDETTMDEPMKEKAKPKKKKRKMLSSRVA